MQFKIHNNKRIQIAELITEGILISNVQDVLDLMGNADYYEHAK